jgi:ketol-acid reductoisomerase
MAGATVYYDDDADLSVLDDRTVAVIGYGNQGRSQALNMRDSGVSVVIGNRSDEYRQAAIDDGFEAFPIAEAADQGDVLYLLVPDEVAPEVFETDIEGQLRKGDALCFSHGYNITYDRLRPPEAVDVVLVAPRMGGWAVRERYEAGTGFPSIVGVHQDYTGAAKERTLALAKAIGSTRSGAIEGTFDMETTADLLTEQGFFPIVLNAMMAKYEVERAHGIPPEIILTELYLSYEMAEILAAMADQGFLGQLPSHSTTSQYGQLSRTEGFDREALVEFYETQLEGIDDGSFARELAAERSADRSELERLYEEFRETDFFEAERETMAKLDLGVED